VIIPVAVEKLALREFAEIASRQEALRTIFSSLLDIFYHPISDFFQKKPSFSTATPVRNIYPEWPHESSCPDTRALRRYHPYSHLLRTADTSYGLERASQNQLYSDGPSRDSTEHASKYLSR
jgi:hypothetical protein